MKCLPFFFLLFFSHSLFSQINPNEKGVDDFGVTGPVIEPVDPDWPDIDFPDLPNLTLEEYEILVVLDEDIDATEIQTKLDLFHIAEEVWVSPLSKTRLWRIQDFGFSLGGDIIDNVTELKKVVKDTDTDVDEIGLNVNSTFTSLSDQNPSCGRYQNIDESEYSIYGESGTNPVRVAIFDTGFQAGEPGETSRGPGPNPFALNTINIVAGKDYVNDDNIPEDNHGHGSHVAGTIHKVAGGTANIEFDIRKVFNEDGVGKLSDVILAIEEAIVDGADILNMSFSFNDDGSIIDSNHPLLRTLEVAEQHGVLIVASAGNDGDKMTSSLRTYPATANESNIISVASTNDAKGKSWFSNYSQTLIDVAAPGENISGLLSDGTNPFCSYIDKTGTSQAAAVVTGMAALIGSHSTDPASTYKDIITNAAAHPAGGRFVRYGAVDMCNIMSALSVPSCTGNRSKEIQGAWKISPNPFQDVIRIDMGNTTIENGMVLVYNTQGQRVVERGIDEEETTIELNTSDLQSHQFFLIQVLGDDVDFTHKIIKGK